MILLRNLKEISKPLRINLRASLVVTHSTTGIRETRRETRKITSRTTRKETARNSTKKTEARNSQKANQSEQDHKEEKPN